VYTCTRNVCVLRLNARSSWFWYEHYHTKENRYSVSTAILTERVGCVMYFKLFRLQLVCRHIFSAFKQGLTKTINIKHYVKCWSQETECCSCIWPAVPLHGQWDTQCNTSICHTQPSQHLLSSGVTQSSTQTQAHTVVEQNRPCLNSAVCCSIRAASMSNSILPTSSSKFFFSNSCCSWSIW